MKRCLVDVNVWFALLVRQHDHHGKAVRWYDSLDAGEAVICRQVQLALMRLLSNRTILAGDAVSALTAWGMIGELCEDERVVFQPETADFASVFPAVLQYRVPAPKLIGDAYLAAFAIGSSLRMVTLDRGFREFRGLDVVLL